ncbi:MAG: SIR2 family protein [Candidatus Scalindua sp.]|nr:SIR2 family protein [Candidatus Scalindua sp.]
MLTGAGFTKNFGGFLASEMWAQIHNRLQRSNEKPVKLLIKDEFDYEKIFEELVKGGKYSGEQKDTVNNSFLEAYKFMDQIICMEEALYGGKHYIDTNGIREFLKGFSNNRREPGFFFTLNQDIVFERYFRREVRFAVPGFIRYINADTIDINNTPFSDSWCIDAPTEQVLAQKKDKMNWQNERFYYIKLHGSFHWKDSERRNMMVIGTSKEEDIEKEPILRWYKNIFENVLSMPDCRLLIIGYGFRDQHINKVIVNSIKDNGLKLFIICPVDPEKFKNDTLKNTGSDNKKIIWEAVSGYYPYTIRTIFPFHKHPTPQHIQLKNDFFQ